MKTEEWENLIREAFVEGHNEGQRYEAGADSQDINDDWEVSDVRSKMESNRV